MTLMGATITFAVSLTGVAGLVLALLLGAGGSGSRD